jgi:hypothetical protein
VAAAVTLGVSQASLVLEPSNPRLECLSSRRDFVGVSRLCPQSVLWNVHEAFHLILAVGVSLVAFCASCFVFSYV